AGADSLVQLFNMLSQAEERKICQPELYELLANLVLVNLDGAFEQKENLDPFSRFVDRDYVALVASVWNHAKQLALEYDRTGKSFAPITEKALKELTEKAKAIAAKGDAYRMAELGMIILAIDPKNKIGRELVALAAQRGVTIP
ncbi:MAG: hypothetical protein NZ914_09735, partial [Gemmatales bacterium]|nr:hypothetical protein [Gemmatales bacterium]